MKRNWLIEARNNKGLTQSDVASRLGLTRQMISAIEKGSTPSVQTAMKMGEVLGFDWTRFFVEEQKGA